jgi:hypothetical protein
MLFHVMWNMEENGTVGVASELERRLPRAWRTRLAREPRLRRGNRTVAPDALITIQAPDGTRAKLLVELKSRVEPLDVEGVLRQLRAYGAGVPLIVARFLSPRTRERIVELGGASCSTARRCSSKRGAPIGIPPPCPVRWDP